MEVFANLTETMEVPTPCGRKKCTVVIQKGEDRFYVRNKEKPDKPGRYVCGGCFRHYQTDPGAGTIMRPPTTATQKRASGTMSTQHISAIRQDVSESQRQGGHTPRGRVTALPSTTASQAVGSGPAIATPQYVFGSMINGQFVPGLPQQAPIATNNGPPVPPPIIGYSGAHAHHAQQTQKWSQLAYRGNGGGGASNIINVNLEIYQPEMDKKGEPVRIPGIKESVTVSADISHHDLYRAISAELRPVFVNYLKENQVPDTDEALNTISTRENTKGMWQWTRVVMHQY